MLTNEDAKADPLAEALDAMASAVRVLNAQRDTGALAALRRGDAVAPAFHILLAQCAPDHLFAGGGETLETMTHRFARVAQIFALKPDALKKKPLGAVLQAIGYPEARLAMLLNARAATLDDLLRRTARRIALSDEPTPYRELGLVALLNGRADRRERLDNLRLKIARDYQRAARRRDTDTEV